MSIRINSWQGIRLSDVLTAYRKAKADCFFERSTYATEAFALFESDLTNNLQQLLDSLHRGEIDFILEADRSAPRFFAKRLAVKVDEKRTAEQHSYFSDADRAFEQKAADGLVPEFRLVGDFSVRTHIISALWINLVGHRFDERLSHHARGSRLRRFRSPPEGSDGKIGSYHLEAIGSFDPYFKPYQQWRDNGLNAMKVALEAGESVIGITLDFSSYYHNIDPTFILDEVFLSHLAVDLNEYERQFTWSMVNYFQSWAQSARALMTTFGLNDEAPTGVPIGLSAVRIITNVLLAEFDRAILDDLNPVYYGRYVDDVFLVMPDPGQIHSSEQLWDLLIERVSVFHRGRKRGCINVRLPGGYQGKSKLLLQSEKQKAFFLSGRAGLDLLASIAHQIRTLSSERRFMPSPSDLDGTYSARVLAAGDNPADEADSLRRADGLTVRRLGWAVQLRSVEILARDLDPKDWEEERSRFYEFAQAHILRADKILEQLDYLPRLLSLAVSVGDWARALEVYRCALRAIRKLRDRTIGKNFRLNGLSFDNLTENVWEELESWVNASCKDATIRAWPWVSGEPQAPVKSTDRFLNAIGLRLDRLTLHAMLLAVRESDLARTPYREHIRLDASRPRQASEDEALLYENYRHFAGLERFLDATEHESAATGVRRVSERCERSGVTGSRIPFLAATRPYSPEEIALYLPEECVFGLPSEAARNWAYYVRAVRGVWSWTDPDAEPPPEMSSLGPSGNGPPDDAPRAPPAAVVGFGPRAPMRLGITSLETSDQSWSAGAAGRSNLSRDRYDRIRRIVNLALQTTPPPTHLLLPELSLPDRWIRTVTAVLQQSGVSIIAGLDYRHYTDGTIDSAALIHLQDNRLGYRASVQIRQPKAEPAPKEEEDLHVLHGMSWRYRDLVKPVYEHYGNFFGVLVCSELQNVHHRLHFQGNVDTLVVLSWNKDLETFSSLVESSSLDVHAFVALVNNRKYGDSRVRAPAKMSFDRDLCRIKGGLNDHLVVVGVDPDELRAQQSRNRRWPRAGDKYKPAPEGFVISPVRRVIPR